jgi:hypothetical protein
VTKRAALELLGFVRSRAAGLCRPWTAKQASISNYIKIRLYKDPDHGKKRDCGAGRQELPNMALPLDALALYYIKKAAGLNRTRDKAAMSLGAIRRQKALPAECFYADPDTYEKRVQSVSGVLPVS